MRSNCCLLILLVFAAPLAAAEPDAATGTRVVLLGTGTPFADPARSGPALAIVVNGAAYLVDFGPGVVRRATAMSPAYGGTIEALDVKQLKVAFLTHLHSDHAAGLPDLLLTPWVLGRNVPLELYGPEGIAEMAANIQQAYMADIRYRIEGLEPANDAGWRVNTHVLDDGVVFVNDDVKVEAFRVRHGSWPNAFGLRFTTADRVIVVSGDTAPDETIEKYAQGADILVHEVYSDVGLAARSEDWQKYHRVNHTAASELGKIASRARPRLLVLYHVLFFGSSEETVLEEVRKTYAGEVVMGHDLDVF